MDSDSFLGLLPGQQLPGNCYKWKVSGPTADLLFQELWEWAQSPVLRNALGGSDDPEQLKIPCQILRACWKRRRWALSWAYCSSLRGAQGLEFKHAV